MKKELFVSLYLDSRRVKQNGKYPLKVRVYSTRLQKQKLLPTTEEFTIERFKEVWNGKIPTTKEELQEYEFLNKLENHVANTASNIIPFQFELLEEALYTSFNEKPNFHELIDELVKIKTRENSLSTAEKYKYTNISLKAFRKHAKLLSNTFYTEEITPNLLKSYETYCRDIRNNSIATIALNMRNIRAVYNIAIEKGLVSAKFYPFGKEKFIIKTAQKSPKALTEDEVNLLKYALPKTPQQQFAKDIWFLSFYCHGMNVVDLARIKHTDIIDNSFEYVRKKTQNTKSVTTYKPVILDDRVKNIIERHKQTKSEYLFGIIEDHMSEEEKVKRVRNFVKRINNHIKKFALSTSIPPEIASKITTYYARHSFATILAHKGEDLALISEIMHDGNIRTTQEYLGKFKRVRYASINSKL